MPQFAPGEAKTAIAPITAKPAGMNCEAELFLGPDELTKAASSDRIPFVSTGARQNVSLPIAMPSEGSYHGYIDVFTEGMRFLAYKTKEDIVVELIEPEPEPWEPTGTLSGTVFASGTNTPLEDAVVEVVATFSIVNQFGVTEIPGYSGHTDHNGRYQFFLVPGVYIIKARKTGYEPVEGEVNVPAGPSTLDIHLAAIVPPDRYATDGGTAMGYNENGTWRAMTLNYSSKYYTGIPVLFKAYRGDIAYPFVQSREEGSSGSYAIERPGTSREIYEIRKTLPKSPYPGGGVDYYMSITNHRAFTDLRVYMYLGTPEGGWKLVKTLGQDF